MKKERLENLIFTEQIEGTEEKTTHNLHSELNGMDCGTSVRRNNRLTLLRTKKDRALWVAMIANGLKGHDTQMENYIYVKIEMYLSRKKLNEDKFNQDVKYN